MAEDAAHISCLFPEILAMIFGYLDVKDKCRSAQVCRAWRQAAYYRSVWKGVEAKLHLKKRPHHSLFPSLMGRGIRRVQVLGLSRSLRCVVKGIRNLESLNLSGCYNLSDAGLQNAFVANMPSLTLLNLSLCKQISDHGVGVIAKHLGNLAFLDVAGCSRITNTGLIAVSLGLTRLKYLNLRSCRNISDTGIVYITGEAFRRDGCSQLECLVLQDCQKITDFSLYTISSGLHSLKSLNLSFCSGISDSGMVHLSRMSCLQELNLRSCDNISDIGVAHLAEGTVPLTSLDVSFCDKVGDSSLIHVAQGLSSMNSLSLSACPISDDGISHLSRSLHAITTLNVGQCNRITDRALTLISEHFKNLSCIDLYGCTKITTVGLEKIMQLPQLTVLNLGLWHKR